MSLRIVSLVVLAFASSDSARAATYNFYFNNTEQGDNSTASPSVTVKSDPASGNAAVATPAPASQVSVAAREEDRREPMFRLFASALSMSQRYTAPNMSQSASSFPWENGRDPFDGFFPGPESGNHNSSGVMIGFGVQPTRFFGMSLYGALRSSSFFASPILAGLDLELMPVHFGGSRGDVVGLGGVLGGLLGSNPDSPGNLHAGAKLAVNLNARIAVNLTWRKSLQSGDGYSLGDLGLAVKF